MGTAEFRNYTLRITSDAGWDCDMDDRISQKSPREVYMYACQCDSKMRPAISQAGTGHCYRVNGTENCGGDACETDTWHLLWNKNDSAACISLWNDTDGNASIIAQSTVYV